MKNISILEAKHVDDKISRFISKDCATDSPFSSFKVLQGRYLQETDHLISYASASMAELRDDMFVKKHADLYDTEVTLSKDEIQHDHDVLNRLYPREWFTQDTFPNSPIRPVRISDLKSIFATVDKFKYANNL